MPQATLTPKQLAQKMETYLRGESLQVRIKAVLELVGNLSREAGYPLLRVNEKCDITKTYGNDKE